MSNPFSGVPYNHVGYSVHGGGGEGASAQWGSDDGKAWTLITLLPSAQLAGMPANYGVKFPQIDLASFRLLPSGEYVGMCGCGELVSGAGALIGEMFEIYLAPDGCTLTRVPRRVLQVGGAAADDENEAAQLASLDYDGTLACVYQGANASNVNRPMLASGLAYNHAAPPDPISYPNHTKTTWDLTGSLSALPAGLTAENGGITFGADYTQIAGGSGIRVTDSVVPDTAGWVEIFIEQAYYAAASAVGRPRLSIGDIVLGAFSGNGVGAAAFSTNSFLVNIYGRSGGATSESALENAYLWGGTAFGTRHKVGLRWVVSSDRLEFLLGNRQPAFALSVPTANSAGTSYLRINPGEDFRLASIEARVGVSSGGVAPVVSGAVTTSSSQITLTLDKDCIGFGAGLTLKVGGVAATGVWQRASATSYTFTAATGTFQSGQTITYDVSSVDVRSIEDLVAIQDVTGAAVSNTL